MDFYVIHSRKELKNTIKLIITILEEIKLDEFQPKSRRNEDELDDLKSAVLEHLIKDLDQLKKLHLSRKVKAPEYIAILGSITSCSAIKVYVDGKRVDEIIYFNHLYNKAAKVEDKIKEAIQDVESIHQLLDYD